MNLQRTRILVADPLRIFRSGVTGLLTRESDFEVVEAADVDGVEAALAYQPVEIALVDLDLPPGGGIAATQLIRATCDAHVVVWSFEPTQATVLAAIGAGAHGYLHKEISPAGLVRSLRGVVRGEAPLSRDLATLMVDAIHRMERQTVALERAAVLSSRERQVLEHVARGARNKQIARALTISEYTVKRHVQNILHKLEVPNRKDAAAFYLAAYAGGGSRA